MDSQTQFKRHISQVFDVLLTIACLLGCGYQVFALATIYFEYDAVTEIVTEIPSQLDLPKTSLCFRFAEVVDYKRLGLEKNINITFETRAWKMSSRAMWIAESMVTIKDIFDYSPPAEKLLKVCWTRSPDDYSTRYHKKNCSGVFDFQKFYLQEYICYRLKRINYKNDYKFKYSAMSVSWPESLYVLQLNSKLFDNGYFLKPILHTDDLPSMSSPLSPWFMPQRDDVKNKMLPYNARLTYGTVTTTLLPPPYKTKCRNYLVGKSGFRNQYHCQTNCITSTCIETIGKVPFSQILTEPYPYKLIGPRDARNSSYLKALSRIEELCSRKCRMQDCDQQYTVTNIDVDTNAAWHAILIKVPQKPFTKIVFRPAMQTVEFIAYLLSCFGTWFGMSVIALNPVKIYDNLMAMHKNTKSHRVHSNSVQNPFMEIRRLEAENANLKRHNLSLRQEYSKAIR